MNFFKNLKNKWHYKLAMMRYRSRQVTRAKMLYYYFIFSGISMFIYAISCVLTGYPYIYTAAPIVFLIAFLVLISIYRNWKLIWLYVSNPERGKLLLYLNRNTNFSEPHKRKLVRWVYLKRNQIRNELWLELSEKVRNGQELTPEEKKLYKKKVVICPQQIQDGINKALLVHVLILAHTQIQVLDGNLLKLMELTPENMQKFDLQNEINRCKVQEEKQKSDKYLKIGKEIIEKRKKNG